MSLLSRLRDWFASLFGSGGEAAGETAPAADHVCTVCGTAVDDSAEGCPLCGSLDVESRTAADATGTADAGGTGTPGPHRQSVEDTTDDAVTRLRDVRRGAEDGAEADAADGDEAVPHGTDPSDGDSDGRSD